MPPLNNERHHDVGDAPETPPLGSQPYHDPKLPVPAIMLHDMGDTLVLLESMRDDQDGESLATRSVSADSGAASAPALSSQGTDTPTATPPVTPSGRKRRPSADMLIQTPAIDASNDLATILDLANLHLHAQYGEKTAIPHIAVIAETNDELIDTPGPAAEASPDETPAVEAIGAIRDPGISVPRRRQKTSSVVTALGYNQFSSQTQGTVLQDIATAAPGQLYEALSQARKEVTGLHYHGGFVPNSVIQQLITVESVTEDLTYQWGRLASRTKKTYLEGATARPPVRPPRPAAIAALARRVCGERPLPSSGATSSDDTDDSSQARRPPPRYQKIFAILVMLELSLRAERFLNEADISDADLPLARWEPDGGPVELCRSQTPDKPLRYFSRNWEPHDRHRFERAQWQVMAPIFGFSREIDRPIKRHILPPQSVLPFTSWTRVGRGGFADIFRAELHGAHHRFDSEGQNKVVAVKKLRGADEAAFRHESMMPKLLAGTPHPHLTALLTMYEQHGEFHLVFDCAESDLTTFWRDTDPRALNSNPNSNGGAATVEWMAKQCVGLASGLLRIHGPHHVGGGGGSSGSARRPPSLTHLRSFAGELSLSKCDDDERSSTTISTLQIPGRSRPIPGRHGDVKSQNVLVFREPTTRSSGSGGGDVTHGTLKLCDYGQAGFRAARPGGGGGPDNNNKRSGGVVVGYTHSSRAPEVELRGGAVEGNTGDMWALGRLYLEFVTWYLGGQALLDEFAARRRLAAQSQKEEEAIASLNADCAPGDVGDGTYGTRRTSASTSTSGDNSHDSLYIMWRCEETGELRAKVREVVGEFIQELHAHPRCSQYCHDVLDMIQHHMLIVEPPAGRKDAPQNQQQPRRYKCREVEQHLRRWYNKCRTEPDYAVAPKPWRERRASVSGTIVAGLAGSYGRIAVDTTTIASVYVAMMLTVMAALLAGVGFKHHEL